MTFIYAPLSALTLNDPGVVGTKDGLAGDNSVQADTTAWAQKLLDMAASKSELIPGETTKYFRTSDTEYSGILTWAGKVDGGSNSVAAGYDYVLGKYDGQNVGYVLFYIGGLATDIPQYSHSIWSANDSTTSYGLSNYTVFNGPPVDVPGVPDGGSTVALLGAALMLLSGIARRRLLFA